ncbi:TIM-barrel domain-containing protein [Tenacibaculum agarivorans]|uniref:TIM-barrel domain-containing protein n=1 Tax=Tenacibaculum agarivorans TaxID=1908389 RepID=UPI00094B8A18|nr:TIM-barrel domain-containing protein [Tenacibaculum agarivorans]
MKSIFSIIYLLFTIAIFAQNENRKFIKASFQDGEFLEVKTNDGVYMFNFYSPEIVETKFVPKGETYKSASHALVGFENFEECKSITFKEDNNQCYFSSCGISVTIQKKPFKISYFYKGAPIVSEKRGYFKSKHLPMDMVKGNITADITEKIEFNLTNDEILYGGGARALGMNRRGNRLPLYNRAHYGYETHSELMNFTMPIVVSSKKYMIHFDNAPIGYLDLDSQKNNTLTYETISGRKTYQIIVGNTWYDLLDNYTDLTGKQPMIPRWSLGNFSSRFGYHSEKETKNTIEAFKKEQIPVDAVILDLYWFGKDIKGTMGNLEVYKDSFPNMKKMIKDFNTQGVKTVLITEPFILTTSKKWDEATSKRILAKDSVGNPFTYDFYFGNTGLIDIYNPEGNQWFWNIYKGLKDIGVAGFWGDLGEPEVHPSKLLHETGTADEVHNVYGHDWARLIFEGYTKEYPNERPFILMRAGYSGSQRFGMIPWSGDVNRTWGGLQSQPEIALQMGMQGLAYMHSDLGGFAGANLDDELYVRWLQYGVFQPIFRPHAQEEVPSEPVFRVDKAKELAKKAIELRYQLLPYNYNLVFENNQTGKPLMRPLFFEESSEDLFEKSGTYLWGNDFLITPVLTTEAKAQEVYFPKKSSWFDFYTDSVINGGKNQIVKTKEDQIPTYVRAGAFIPMTKVVQTTQDYSFNNFDLHFYYHPSVKISNRSFYNDDGVTANSFEKKQYEILEFNSKSTKKTISIQLNAKIGAEYKDNTKELVLVIHHIKSKPRKVKVAGKTATYSWDATKNRLSVPLQWNTAKAKKITIKL